MVATMRIQPAFFGGFIASWQLANLPIGATVLGKGMDRSSAMRDLVDQTPSSLCGILMPYHVEHLDTHYPA